MADKKKKGFFGEFREFISRGNVMDLAVGVIIGGAFQAIVKSLVDDIIMPLISLITKGINFADWFVVLTPGVDKPATLALAQEAGLSVLSYGNFIAAIINFLIMAIVIFCIVKAINTVNAKVKKPVEEKKPRLCPYCKGEVDEKATRCPHCTSDIEGR
ncbi:MAG: large conductance mechanosensitive channel protein MscL [Clostridia bacterium]|nr:large conductance mechanosensitive channel protein MscL [Clostridia bacterium]